MKLTITLLFGFYSSIVFGQGIVGKWKTIDDNSGKPRSVIEIYEKDGEYFGEIVKLFRGPEEEQDPVCDKCEGKKKGQKIIGMEIITDMVYDNDDQEYDGGEILDPESGSVYDCKFWLEDDKLMVRGYLMFFYRTQTWLPYEGG